MDDDEVRAVDHRSAQNWVHMAMVQLARLRDDRTNVTEVRIGHDRKTFGSFILMRGDMHFLVLCLDHLRFRLERLDMKELAATLPGYDALRDARNAFEHPGGDAPAHFQEKHGEAHDKHWWTITSRGQVTGTIAGVITDEALDDVLLTIENRLWSED